MDDLTKIIAAGAISFGVGYALRFVEPRSKVVWWSPHAFWFDLDAEKTRAVFTHSLTIQNIGRKAAECVEIVHRTRPELFKLNPSLDFTEVTTPDGQHIIRIASLARREFFSIEFISAKAIPELLYVRTKDGHSERIPIQPQRIFPRWYLGLLQGFILIGIAFTIYWLIRAGIFISSHF